MKTVSITVLKAKLSEHLAHVKAGEEVIITERGLPIARIQPLPETARTARTAKKVREGRLILAPKGPMSPEEVEQFLRRRPEDPNGAVLKALLAEREEDY
ncbi:MAG TPA: type II toxin-antitoxin system prevent-host-death family antitoxin [Thermoanaerobaculia bacterium]|nr:type II toxin-antitoxin system prevent-host-death family antitoxin [Thermoanaerobaculia bacterium]